MAYEFRCQDAGHFCGWHGDAASEEELKAKVAAHVAQKHKAETTETIWNFVKTKIRQR